MMLFLQQNKNGNNNDKVSNLQKSDMCCRNKQNKKRVMKTKMQQQYLSLAG